MPGKIIDEKVYIVQFALIQKTQFEFASNVYLPLSPLSRLLIVFFLSANNANENNKQAREMDHSWTADN